MSSQELPFKKDQIRSALNMLSVGDAIPDDLPVMRYRAFYGIDFENQIEGVTASIGIVKAAGYDVVAQIFQQADSKGTIFVFHGLYDHVGIFDKPIAFFLAHGYSVVAYDLPGHGISSGNWVSIKSFYRYQQVLKAVLNTVQTDIQKPIYAVAQSTGAAVLIDSLLSRQFTANQYPFEKLVLLAPLVRPVNWSRNKTLHTVLSPFLDYIPRSFSFNSHDQTFLSFLKNDDSLQSKKLSSHWVGALKKWVPNIENAKPIDYPVCIIQGQEDTTVDWEHNIPLLQEKLLNLNISMIPPMRHQVVNEIDSIRALVFNKALLYIES